MTDVTVDSADIGAVRMAWDLLSGAGTVSGYQRVAVLTVANQALERMGEACARRDGPMPEDPVTGADEAVVMDAALLDRYMANGFTRDEAFALVHATVQARAHANGLAIVAMAQQKGMLGGG